MLHLENGTKIGAYQVKRFIKDGLFNGNYQVADEAGNLFFMKLFDWEAVPQRLRVGDTVTEIVNSRRINHPNVVSYVADGGVSFQDKAYPVLLMQYFQGSLLSEYLQEGRVFTSSEARALIIPILQGLVYLEQSCDLNHNDITPRNILLETASGATYVPKLIDLGHAHATLSGDPPFPLTDLNLLYAAPETFQGVFSPESDAFSIASVLYTMLCGTVPWNLSIDPTDPYEDRKARVSEARKRIPVWPVAIHSADPALRNVILTGLRLDPAQRPTPEKMLEMLTGKAVDVQQKAATTSNSGKKTPADGLKATTDSTSLKKTLQRGGVGGGFADVAGMDDLKKMLTERVIWVLRDKAKAQKYRLTPPNGMLLYGPPGCGKTYFAEKFAEESRFNYMVVNGSDLGSTYIHGTQGKIAALFQEAAAKAPTVLCFDEFDSFVPSRGSEAARHRPEEVNEFLSQLNNCAKRGIFVIGTTNRMDMIDPAVLRKGRLDLLIEVPAPEHETRRLMFAHHLKGRPLANDIDLARLADLTEGYASSDIAFIANDAALVAALADEAISQRHLEDAIRCNPSSLGKKSARTPIGYK
jgi:transitional endoplasmic reticulum ATPase